jgi:hypothetical protein
MKNYHFSPKTLITVLIACLLPISAVAQLRTPENVPITFYGKVVDQSGQPVQGAKVSLLVITSHFERYDTEAQPVTLETDQNGGFTVTGFVANAVDAILIKKQGYELSKKATLTYVFGSIPTYTPDPKNPVVFRMWKQAGKEPLVGPAWRGKVACDGTTNRFDLSSGRPSADGGLEIICSKTPLTVPPPGSAHFDYKFQIVVIGGSIRPTEDEFTYLAPENGYSPSVTITQKADDPKWQGSVKQEFYFKTGEGHYGRLSVDWYAWQTPPTILKWDCSINPSGSRNLER